ncbi:MAG: sigma-70 family RNA polymerase sigma factor [Ruminococcus sp.]|nr:sigma-70 family RNA polymerase sigma factor [Ruminococcus sp.]
MNDDELLELLRRDPQKGLVEVVRLYSAYVMKIARTKLGDVCSREDIEETVSDIFLKFYTSGLSRGFDIKSIRGFISVIAQRHCTDVFRSRCKRPETADYSELENIIADNEQLNGMELIAAIKKLGEPDSYIFIRKYYFGQKNEDIARELGMKPGALNTRVSRGLKKLRKMIEEGL